MTERIPKAHSAERLLNVHPGEVLTEEFLEPMGISQNQLAREIRVPANRISQLARGERAVTADTALRLARFFGTTAEFWLGLQADYDVGEERHTLAGELERIVPIERPTADPALLAAIEAAEPPAPEPVEGRRPVSLRDHFRLLDSPAFLGGVRATEQERRRLREELLMLPAANDYSYALAA